VTVLLEYFVNRYEYRTVVEQNSIIQTNLITQPLCWHMGIWLMEVLLYMKMACQMIKTIKSNALYGIA